MQIFRTTLISFMQILKIKSSCLRSKGLKIPGNTTSMHLDAVRRNLSKATDFINLKYPGVTVTEDLCKKTCNLVLEYSNFLSEGHIQKVDKMTGLEVNQEFIMSYANDF